MRIYLSWVEVVLVLCFLTSCTNDAKEVAALTTKADASKDIGTNIRITYSDSASIKAILECPLLEKHNDVNNPIEVFKEGVKISFLDANKRVNSWLEADEMIRDARKKKMTARGNVRFYNTEQEKLQTAELIWDEASKKIYTEKFIKITRPIKGDTIYGIGFVTDQDFKIIEVKRRIQGKVQADMMQDAINP